MSVTNSPRDDWRNVASLELAPGMEVIARLDRDPVAAEQVVEVVREAISNAIRHGRATRQAGPPA